MGLNKKFKNFVFNLRKNFNKSKKFEKKVKVFSIKK